MYICIYLSVYTLYIFDYNGMIIIMVAILRIIDFYYGLQTACKLVKDYFAHLNISQSQILGLNGLDDKALEQCSIYGLLQDIYILGSHNCWYCCCCWLRQQWLLG